MVVVLTAEVAEAAATPAADLEVAGRTLVDRARPLEAAAHMRAARALAQTRAITGADIGGIRFIAVPLGARLLPARVLRRDRTRVPNILRPETIHGRSLLRPLGAHLEA